MKRPSLDFTIEAVGRVLHGGQELGVHFPPRKGPTTRINLARFALCTEMVSSSNTLEKTVKRAVSRQCHQSEVRITICVLIHWHTISQCVHWHSISQCTGQVDGTALQRLLFYDIVVTYARQCRRKDFYCIDSVLRHLHVRCKCTLCCRHR